ncbi:MAG: PDZ domain-containing protein [Anaerovibrio sp.]|nr:PDZ domain-containing protein [Anaerovibrio sp.]
MKRVIKGGIIYMKKYCVIIITLFYLIVIQIGNAFAAPVIVENGSLQSVNQIAMSVMSRWPKFSLVSATSNILIYNAKPDPDDLEKCVKNKKDGVVLTNIQIIINIVENGPKKKVVNATGNMSLTDIKTGATVSLAAPDDWAKDILSDIKCACDGWYVYGFNYDETTITNVVPGKAFAKAGIEPNSKIISINGKNATEYKDVLDMRQCPAVTLVVEKDGKMKTLELKGNFETPEQFRAQHNI